MPKAYLISVHRVLRDPDKVAAYGKLAAPAMEAAGGRYLVRGMPARAYEAGLPLRTAIVEFPTLEQALGVYESAAYKKALAELGDGAERDIRIVEGVE